MCQQFLRTFLANRLGTHYITNCRTNPKNAEQLDVIFDNILQDNRYKNIPQVKFGHKRLMEQLKPALQRKYAAKESQRRRDREEMAFFCKYVLASKNKKIPLN